MQMHTSVPFDSHAEWDNCYRSIWPTSLKYLLSGTVQKVLAAALVQHKITIKYINAMNLYSSYSIISKCINKTLIN